MKTYPACKGKNCGCIDGKSHSDECIAEYERDTKVDETKEEITRISKILCQLDNSISNNFTAWWLVTNGYTIQRASKQ